MHFLILGAGLFITWLVGEVALMALKDWMRENHPSKGSHLIRRERSEKQIQPTRFAPIKPDHLPL